MFKCFSGQAATKPMSPDRVTRPCHNKVFVLLEKADGEIFLRNGAFSQSLPIDGAL
jgi:hypothetical protein